ncbi:MAG TPA: SsrA-binding protein SmpB [Actinomycetota bacterium]
MAKQKAADSNDRVIAQNRRARHDFDIEQTYEAGIALLGSEVKTLRAGKANLGDAYALVRNGEVFVYGLHIPEYQQSSYQNHEPTRPRKLLLHGDEIHKMQLKTEQQGYTLVPLRLYFKGNRVKLQVAVARGRKRHDKRQAIAEREAKREIQRRAGTRRG